MILSIGTIYYIYLSVVRPNVYETKTMKDETIFEVKRTNRGLTAECKIADGGINTVIALMQTLDRIRKELHKQVMTELKGRGFPLPPLEGIDKKLYEEVSEKLKTMTPEDAEQFIKDVHGLLVKGK